VQYYEGISLVEMNESDDDAIFHSCDPEEYKSSSNESIFIDASYTFGEKELTFD